MFRPRVPRHGHRLCPRTVAPRHRRRHSQRPRALHQRICHRAQRRHPFRHRPRRALPPCRRVGRTPHGGAAPGARRGPLRLGRGGRRGPDNRLPRERPHDRQRPYQRRVYRLQRSLLDGYAVGEKFSFEKEVLQPLVRPFRAYAADGYFIDIGIPDDYRRAQTELPQL